MSTNSPTRKLLLVGPVLAALVGGAAFLYGTRAPAAGDVHVATSICDAHRLKRLAAEDPHFAIEIPPEFNQLFPTADACRSYERAADENAPGPTQPIAFSHAHHSGTFQIDCLYCHSGSERSQAAGVPSVEVCMGCHSQFGPAYDEFDGIKPGRRFTVLRSMCSSATTATSRRALPARTVTALWKRWTSST